MLTLLPQIKESTPSIGGNIGAAKSFCAYPNQVQVHQIYTSPL